MENQAEQPTLYFKRISASSVNAVCRLSQTLSPAQRNMVADNALSIAQAHLSEAAWMRAIYLEGSPMDGEPIGFIMLHFGSDFDDGLDCPGAFLWRLMIAGPYQGKGYGRMAIQRLVGELKAQGYTELYTSVGQGEGSPLEFYRRLGFVPTGGYYGEQIELVFKW